jgi:hypothetical protein
LIYFLLIFVSLLTSLAAAIFFHELGHVLAARLVGLQLREIRLGVGRQLFRFKVDRTEIFLHAFPMSGEVSLFPSLRHRGRFTELIFIFAGPLFDFISTFLLFFLILKFNEYPFFYVCFSCCFVVQVYLMLKNILPGHVWVYGRKVPNDGMQIVTFFLKRKRTFEDYEQQFLAEVQSYYSEIPYPVIFSAASERVAYYRICIANGWVDDLEKCLSALELELHGDLSECEKIVLLDFMVTEFLSRPNIMNIEKLDEWSATALSILPNSDHLKASRGSVLIELGRIEEGFLLFSQLRFSDAFNNSIMLAYEALGNYKYGKLEVAQEIFARSLSDYSSILSRNDRSFNIIKRVGEIIGFDMNNI